MKSETSFRVFFLKQHRKNSLKNIFFPSESVFLDFSFWPQRHRSTQNAHCALLRTSARLILSEKMTIWSSDEAEMALRVKGYEQLIRDLSVKGCSSDLGGASESDIWERWKKDESERSERERSQRKRLLIIRSDLGKDEKYQRNIKMKDLRGKGCSSESESDGVCEDDVLTDSMKSFTRCFFKALWQ